MIGFFLSRVVHAAFTHIRLLALRLGGSLSGRWVVASNVGKARLRLLLLPLKLGTRYLIVWSSALQPLCRVDRNMRGVHHHGRIHKGASQTCHTVCLPLQKLSVSKNEPLTNQ